MGGGLVETPKFFCRFPGKQARSGVVGPEPDTLLEGFQGFSPLSLCGQDPALGQIAQGRSLQCFPRYPSLFQSIGLDQGVRVGEDDHGRRLRTHIHRFVEGIDGLVEHVPTDVVVPENKPGIRR